MDRRRASMAISLALMALCTVSLGALIYSADHPAQPHAQPTIISYLKGISAAIQNKTQPEPVSALERWKISAGEFFTGAPATMSDKMLARIERMLDEQDNMAARIGRREFNIMLYAQPAPCLLPTPIGTASHEILKERKADGQRLCLGVWEASDQ